jgi:DNA mismatch repair protein MutS2
LKLGERVFLRTLNSEGIITVLAESEAEVQIGALRLRAKLSDLGRPTEVEEQKTEDQNKNVKRKGSSIAPSSTTHRPASAVPHMELDLRGQRAEDALAQLDDYLDRAFLAGMPFVRIIHGKGTGKLRAEVRAALKESPHVSSFEEGLPSEGGDGVTVAKIVKE